MIFTVKRIIIDEVVHFNSKKIFLLRKLKVLLEFSRKLF